MQQRRVLTAVCAGVIAVMSLVSCSDSKDERVAKIGVIAPLDGGLVQFGRGIRNSVQLAVDEANRRGAVDGWRLEVEAADDSSDATKGEQAARRLAADPDLIGVVGTYNSGVAAKVAPVLEGAGVVMISPGNTDPSLTKGTGAQPSRPHRNYFRMVAADDVQAPFLAQAAWVDLAARRVAVVSETKPVSKGLADGFAAAYTAAGGAVVYSEVVPDGATDFAGVVADIAPLAPDLVFFGGEYDVGSGFTQQLSAGGVAVPVMGGDGLKDDAYITKAGATSEGDLASTVGAPLASLSKAQLYVEGYQKAGFAEPPSDFGVYAYDATNVIIAAAAKTLPGVSDVTAKARADMIAAVQATDLAGASGRLAFDAFGDTQTKVLTLYRVSGAAWTPTKTETVS